VNRHERRAQKAIGRAATEKLQAGATWKQWVDPMEPEFSVIEFRMPTGPCPMPAAAYTGVDALARARRFAENYLSGVADGIRDREREGEEN
jgi:hypothetical protein